MNARIRVGAALFGLLATAGCLQKDTRHVLYLAHDGGVVWMTTESDVWSDEQDPRSRDAEEEAYLLAVQNGTHSVAQGLGVLAPKYAVRTHILRSERPFTVVTTATFASVADTLWRLFEENGIPAAVTLEREGPHRVLRLQLDFGMCAERETPAGALLEDVHTLAIVLTEGTFVQADGFDLEDSHRVARLSADWFRRAEDAAETGGTVVLVLTWRVE
jgi:hypothetical protein